MLYSGKSNPGMTAPENRNNDLGQNETYSVSTVFAHKLKKERKRQKLSQEKLAEKAGLSRETIIRYENADDHALRFDNVLFIVKALNMPITHFIPDSLFVPESPYVRAKKALEELEDYLEKTKK